MSFIIIIGNSYLYFHVVLNYHLGWVASGWKTYFRISCKVSLLAKNSLSLYFSGNIFYLYFWKRVLLDVSSQLPVFTFSTLSISCHCLQASIISYSESTVNPTGVLLYISCFLLPFSKFSLCPCLSAFFLPYAWLWISFYFSFLGFIELLNCADKCFPSNLDVFSHYFFKSFFCSSLPF